VWKPGISSGRVYAKERNWVATAVVLEELPKTIGWQTRKLANEPCMYEIDTSIGNDKAYVLVHTDD
jgi:hypothetical protein